MASEHFTIHRQLNALKKELKAITDRDPEQEVQGIAVGTLDAVITEARLSWVPRIRSSPA